LIRTPGEIVEGKIFLNNINLLELSKKEIRDIRGKDITMIFQDPLNSLNPVMKIGDQVSEVFLLHQEEELNKELDKEKLEREQKIERIGDLEEKLEGEKERLSDNEIEEYKLKIRRLKKESKYIPRMEEVLKDKIIQAIDEVGIPDPEGIIDRYPHELSGGMRQRIMIAMAIACNPKLLIADEPTTALDVTIQAQIMELMKDLKEEHQTSILMITHDLGLIAEMCDRVAVMYSGNIVEYATAETLFNNPSHPYTKGLIAAIPKVDKRDKKLKTIRGAVPNLIFPPFGCRFHPRCPKRMEICDQVRPRWIEFDENHFVGCHLFDPEYNDSPKYNWSEEEKEESFYV